jgi:hypothetical protein
MDNKQCCKTVYTITGSGLGIDTSHAGTNADFCCMADGEKLRAETSRGKAGAEETSQVEEQAGCCGGKAKLGAG